MNSIRQAVTELTIQDLWAIFKEGAQMELTGQLVDGSAIQRVLSAIDGAMDDSVHRHILVTEVWRRLAIMRI